MYFGNTGQKTLRLGVRIEPTALGKQRGERLSTS